jgi:hypothetical protein
VSVSRTTPGGIAYLDLQKQARSSGRPVQELLQLYVLGAFHAEEADIIAIDSAGHVRDLVDADVDHAGHIATNWRADIGRLIDRQPGR